MHKYFYEWVNVCAVSCWQFTLIFYMLVGQATWHGGPSGKGWQNFFRIRFFLFIFTFFLPAVSVCVFVCVSWRAIRVWPTKIYLQFQFHCVLSPLFLFSIKMCYILYNFCFIFHSLSSLCVCSCVYVCLLLYKCVNVIESGV